MDNTQERINFIRRQLERLKKINRDDTAAYHRLKSELERLESQAGRAR